MADPPNRSKPTGPDEPGSRQLTLDEWANVQEAARGGPNHAEASRETQLGDGPGRSTGKRPAATELLDKPEALLTRSDLRELGLQRRAVDAVFRALPVVAFPGYARPLVRVDDFRELVERNTFRDDRVRPGMRAA